MHSVVWQRRIVAVVGFLFCLFTLSGTFGTRAEAALLSISGIAEGSVLTLPGGVATTNLSVVLAGSGLGASPQVGVSLEWQGSILRQLTSSMPSSVVLTNLPAGKYFLEAHDLATPAVTADLSFDLLPASIVPANDSWQHAPAIPGFNVTVTGTNLHATREAGEPTPFANGSGGTVWWSWQAAAPGLVSATTVGSSFDTTLAVFTGTSVSNLTVVGSSDDAGPSPNQFSQVTFNATAGMRYFLVVDGATSAEGVNASGAIQLRLVPAVPPGLTVASPVDGAVILVPNATSATNVPFMVNVSEPVVRVDYWIDGPVGARQGELASPYQLSLTNLVAGDYVLTAGAMDSAGLVRYVDARFSILSLAPEIQLSDAPEFVPASLPLAVTGLKGTNYTLQRSDDLATWSPAVKWTNFPGAEKVLLERRPLATGGFYRGVSP